MLRMHLVALLGLSVAAAAQGDAPKPDPKPQWQRLLTFPDTLKASYLQKRIEALETAENYTDAMRPREELLALRTRVQGADHWETVDEKWALMAAKKVAALSKEKRAGWRQSEKSAASAGHMVQQAQYGKALALCQEQLKWRREVLGEEHPDTAITYNNVAYNLNEQGKYGEAALLYQKSLDIRRKVLGDKHPDTADSYNGVASNLNAQGKYKEAAILYQKALDIRREVLGENHYDTASSYNNVAYILDAQGEYKEAALRYQKSLDIWRKVLGDDHPRTVTSYNNVAVNLANQGKYAEADPLFRKSLDIRRKVLGEDHPDTATSYNNVGGNLNAQGKYAEAGPLVQKALDIFRRILGENHPHTAQVYNNLASNLAAQGQCAEAGLLFQKSLDIHRKVLGENHPETAASYNRVADNLSDQGKYAEAGLLAQKALDIDRKVLGDNNLRTAECYYGVAYNLNGQGKYAEAGPSYQKALDIRRKILGEDHPLTAESYHATASNWTAQGKYAEADPLIRKSLDICRKILGEDHPKTAASYNAVAYNLNARGKYSEADLPYQKVLDIDRKILGDNHRRTAASYWSVAYNLQAQGKYSAALASLERAARSYEAARLSLTVTGLDRAAYGAERSPYPFLAAARSRAGRSADAWTALEANLARGLLDDMALRRGLGPTPAEQRQRDELRAKRSPLDTRILALASRPQRTTDETVELDQLVAQRRQLDKSLAELAVLVSRREMDSLTQFQTALPADAAFIAWVDVVDNSGGVKEHWGCVVRPKGSPQWEQLPGSVAQGKWSPEDSLLPTRFREALTGSAPEATIDALAKKLHAQRLAPLSKHLDGVKQLFVAPVNQMAGIPLEALTDQYTISYTPSATYLTRLKDRSRPHSAGLLAIGDPLFPPTKVVLQPTALPPGGLLLTQVLPGGSAAQARLQTGDVLVAYAGEELTSVQQFGKLIAAKAGEKSVVVKVWREGQEKVTERELAPGRLGVTVAKEPAREVLTARRRADQLLAKLSRGETFAELPGTQVEIARLAELFDPGSVATLTRDKASEQRLDQLRRAGTLTQYRYLHFATHGKANNVRAFESVLMLTPPARLPEVRVGEPYLDGRLTATEVLAYWKLDCELVTLSACESGLGRQGGGDGLLGFAQAFLMAGSRSVCLTLWQVDDTATALLMDRFYRNLLGKGGNGKAIGKAAALREAKQWLRTVTAGEALERLGTLTQGVVRGERPAREEMKAVPKPKDAAKDYKPYAHPRYWAAFILIGDPE